MAYEDSWEECVPPMYWPLVRTRRCHSAVVGSAEGYMEAGAMAILKDC